jgi:hypothetical protein
MGAGGIEQACAAVVLSLVVSTACRESSLAKPTSKASPASASIQPAVASAVASSPRPLPSVDFGENEGNEVIEVVDRLRLVDEACGARCSYTVGNDGTRWFVTVGSNRDPAPLTALHLFSVFVEPVTRKPVSIEPGAMYGFCKAPIPIEKWDAYAAKYRRFQDGHRKTPPECP